MKVVKIKTWDNMKQEYGLGIDGNISSEENFAFTSKMEELLPKNRIIFIKYDDMVNEWVWKYRDHTACITPEMIRKYLNPKDYPQYFI